MGNKNILTFDLGGTSLRAGRYCAETDRLFSLKIIGTPNYRSSRYKIDKNKLKSLSKIIRILGKLVLKNKNPDIVSLAFAGPVDSIGNAIAAPTILGNNFSYPFNLIEIFGGLWPKAKIFVINDLTAAGYYYNKKYKDFCIITVSSGIGSKVFLDRQPILGANAVGGEIGHLRIDLSACAPVCGCGQRGHLEAIASGRATLYQINKLIKAEPFAYSNSALGKRFGKSIKRIDNESIVEFAKKGDKWTLKLVNEMARPLGKMIATLHLTIGIERFIIIGGFAIALGKYYRVALVKAAKVYSWKLSKNWERMIEIGTLDDKIGLIGAGRFAAYLLDLPTK